MLQDDWWECTDLFIGHKLDGRFRRNFEDIDTISPPERGDASLLDHPPQPGPQINPPRCRAMYLDTYPQVSHFITIWQNLRCYCRLGCTSNPRKEQVQYKYRMLSPLFSSAKIIIKWPNGVISRLPGYYMALGLYICGTCSATWVRFMYVQTC